MIGFFFSVVPRAVTDLNSLALTAVDTVVNRVLFTGEVVALGIVGSISNRSSGLVRTLSDVWKCNTSSPLLLKFCNSIPFHLITYTMFIIMVSEHDAELLFWTPPALFQQISNRYLAEHMAMHTCQIGPTDTAPPCLGSPPRALFQRGNTLRQATFLSPFLLRYLSVHMV